MDWTSRLRDAFAFALHRPDDDVIEELAQHARAMYEKERADGASDEDAHRRVAAEIDRWRADAAALRRRAPRAPAVEAPAAVSRSRLFGIGNDVRYAARLLRRQPRFALLVILTMALGIGATTVLFSVTYGVLVKPLPWANGTRIVLLKETRGGAAPRFGEFTNAAYLAWREKPETIESIAAWSARAFTMSGAGDPERIRVTTATASLFDVLGTRPLIGSLFGPAEESSPVIVLSEGLWRQRFNADPAVLGKAVHLDGTAHTIVGVLPDAAMYPDRQTRAIVPLVVRPVVGNYLSLFRAIALLRPGATAAQAAFEGTARGRFAADTGLTTQAIFGQSGAVGVTAQPLREALTADVRRPLLVLLAGVALLLVTATANVASLQLARTTTRSREMAIRAALGAGGARVTRQLLVESVLLGAIGGLAGLALAWFLHRSIRTLLPADFPRIDDLTVDAAVVTFAVAISIGTSALVGVLPAIRVRSLNLAATLSEDGTSAIGVGRRSRTAQARMLIMAGQVAIACMLLVGASLLVRSFTALWQADRGFDPSAVMTAMVSMPDTLFTAERRFAVTNDILARLALQPGVAEAAFTSEMPLTPGGSTMAFSIPPAAGEGSPTFVQASPRTVSPRFFTAIGMRIIEGRGFTDADTATSQSVVVVNRSFARKYLGNRPIGAKLPVASSSIWGGRSPGDDESLESTVVGVVDDVRYVGGGTVSQPELYFSHRQQRSRLSVATVTLMVRTAGDAAALAPAIRSIVRSVDDQLASGAILTLEDRLLTTLARPRLYAMLLGGFAGFAILIAAVGLFGVLSYTVAQRSREFAVRTALGARQIDIVSLVLRQGGMVAGTGILAGLAASAVLARSMGALLYGVTPHDGVSYTIVPIVLCAVAALACVAPARRAAKLDPLRLLRGNG